MNAIYKANSTEPASAWQTTPNAQATERCVSRLPRRFTTAFPNSKSVDCVRRSIRCLPASLWRRRRPGFRLHHQARRKIAVKLAAVLVPGAVALFAAHVLQPMDDDAFSRTLAANKGKVVLLDFCATWCDPCRA